MWIYNMNIINTKVDALDVYPVLSWQKVEYLDLAIQNRFVSQSRSQVQQTFQQEYIQRCADEMAVHMVERDLLKLDKLDIMSPAQIFCLTQDLKKKRRLLSMHSRKRLDAVVQGLELLRHPVTFSKPSAIEEMVMGQWMEGLGEYGLS